MLPDIPETKLDIHKQLTTVLKRKIEHDHPILARVKRITQHEGLIHEHEQIGFGMVSEGYQELSVPFTLRWEDIPDLLGERLLQKTAEIAEGIGKQEMQGLFRAIDEATEKAGTKIDGEGKPMTAEKILQLIEMTQVDFDSAGRPTSTFVIHPAMAETARKISEQIENDPELKARAEEIRRKHYHSWLDRENNRKLVD